MLHCNSDRKEVGDCWVSLCIKSQVLFLLPIHTPHTHTFLAIDSQYLMKDQWCFLHTSFLKPDLSWIILKPERHSISQRLLLKITVWSMELSWNITPGWKLEHWNNWDFRKKRFSHVNKNHLKNKTDSGKKVLFNMYISNLEKHLIIFFQAMYLNYII